MLVEQPKLLATTKRKAKWEESAGVSRKLKRKYRGLLQVEVALPNDRYKVRDLAGRTAGRSCYEATVAVDRMKPWWVPGGVSDEYSSEEEEFQPLDPSESPEDGAATSGSRGRSGKAECKYCKYVSIKIRIPYPYVAQPCKSKPRRVQAIGVFYS